MDNANGPQPITYKPLYDPEHGFRDLAVTTVEVHLGWTDRLRAAVAGRVDVKVRLYTENVIGRNETTSEVTILWPWVRWSRNRGPRIGYVVEE